MPIQVVLMLAGLDCPVQGVCKGGRFGKLVRVLVTLLLLAVSLGGCVGSPSAEPISAFGACPHWEPRGEPIEMETLLTEGQPTYEREWIPRNAAGDVERYNGRHGFDLFQLTVKSVSGNGTVELVATVPEQNGTFLRIFDHGDVNGYKSLPKVTLGPGIEDRLYEIFITPPEQSQDVRPDPVALNFTVQKGGDVELSYTLQFFDRICGIPSN